MSQSDPEYAPFAIAEWHRSPLRAQMQPEPLKYGVSIANVDTGLRLTTWDFAADLAEAMNIGRATREGRAS